MARRAARREDGGVGVTAMTDDDPSGDERLVPVRRRVVVLETGETVERRTVHCPLSGVRAVGACEGCERLISVDASGSHEALRCHVHHPVGANVTVDEALGRDSWCLDPELPVGPAISLLEARHLSSAPVVDDAGVLIGIVRLEALRQLAAQSRALALKHPDIDDVVTEEALEPALGVLTADEPLANAAQKMSLHGVSELPVIEHDETLVGVLTAADLLRYFTRR
jgi:CBS domain-containing protein